MCALVHTHTHSLTRTPNNVYNQFVMLHILYFFYFHLPLFIKLSSRALHNSMHDPVFVDLCFCSFYPFGRFAQFSSPILFLIECAFAFSLSVSLAESAKNTCDITWKLSTEIRRFLLRDNKLNFRRIRCLTRVCVCVIGYITISHSSNYIESTIIVTIEANKKYWQW